MNHFAKIGRAALAGALAALLCCGTVSAAAFPTPPVQAASAKTYKPASTPAEALDLALKALKATDIDAFNAYTDNIRGSGNMIMGDTSQPLDDVEQELATEMFRALSWSLETPVVKGDKATVIAKITNANIGSAMSALIRSALKLNPNDPDEEAFEKELLAAIRQAQKTPITLTTDVTLNRENGRWRVHLDEGFVNAVFGDMMTGIEKAIPASILSGILGELDLSGAISDGWTGAGLSFSADALKDLGLRDEIDKALESADIQGEIARALQEADIQGEIERALRDAFAQ